MNYESMIDQQEVKRCALCDNAPCSTACEHGVDAGKIIRSMYFDNVIGAAMQQDYSATCLHCSAPCEKSCVRQNKDQGIHIKQLMEQLDADKQFIERDQYENRYPLSIEMSGVTIENPFLLSSSVVASNYEMCAKALDMGWAGIVYKTVCDFIPREVSPRFSALKHKDSSFYGFKNIEQLSVHGIEEDMKIIRRLKENYPGKVIIVSVMGRNEEEWTRLARLCEEAKADILECNFSCPNMETEGLGSDVGQSPDLVRLYTEVVKAAVNIPVWTKMTPNTGNMTAAAVASAEGGADGIAAINTIKSVVGINLATYASSPSVHGKVAVGGYSGKAVKPIALRFISEMAQCEDLSEVPLSGIGGIETWKDALEFLFLGASTVQITTAVMQYGYRIIDDLKEGLSLYMAEQGFQSVKELVGLGLDSLVGLDSLERCSIIFPKFLRQKCMGCGRCALSCYDGGHQALTMEEEGAKRHPKLNGKKCVGCHLCVLVCPFGAISGTGKRVMQKIYE